MIVRIELWDGTTLNLSFDQDTGVEPFLALLRKDINSDRPLVRKAVVERKYRSVEQIVRTVENEN